MASLRDTPNGYNPFEVMSALQKCIRRGVEYDAYWWADELVQNNQASVVWNRLEVIACEDIGMADPNALLVVHACRAAWERKSRGDAEVNILAFAVMYLCRAKKSRTADDLAHLVWLRKDGRDPKTRVKDASLEKEHLTIPDEALDMHTRRGKARMAAEASRFGTSVKEIETCVFRTVGALLNKPTKDVSQSGVNWTEEVCRVTGINPNLAFAPADSVDDGEGVDE